MVNIALYNGQSGVWFGDAIYAALVKGGFPTVLAAYLDEAAGDLPDKLITVLVALLIYQGLPDINGAGFYFRKDAELVLGPFQGKPA